MSNDDLAAVAQESTFIFAGSVISRGASSVKTVPAAADLAVATFRRAFRVNPMLGDLAGLSRSVSPKEPRCVVASS